MSRISFLFFVLFLGITLFVFPILPGPLAVRHADAASITLAWDPNSEPDLAGYKLYYGTAKGVYEFAIDLGNQATYTIPGFLERGDYYFAVTAYNVYGLESAFSDEVSYAGPPVVTISLSTGMNFISLPIEPLDPAVAALTGQISPCLRQVFTYMNDTSVYYDPSQPDQSTISTMEPGKGYWVQMACPGEMTVVGNRTTKPISLTVGRNYVGYNSLTPLPISEALAGIANKYTKVWAYEGDRGIFNRWIFYDPNNVNASALKVLSPGSGFYIEATEETIWTLPYIVTISLSAGMNLISLPIEPLDPSIAALTGQLSPCLRQIQTYVNDASVYYDPSQPDQNTLSTMEAGKGYWVQMACPGEMTVVGNRTTKPISLTVGRNYVGYNSLTPLPISEALTGIANKYTKVWAYKGDRGIFNRWIFYDPNNVNASALKVLSPGSGFYIEATEETIWTLPYIGY